MSATFRGMTGKAPSRPLVAHQEVVHLGIFKLVLVVMNLDLHQMLFFEDRLPNRVSINRNLI